MIQLDLASKARPRPRAGRKTADHAGALIREAIEVSRSLTADLSPPVLYEGSLPAALHWLARHMGERHSLEVQVEAPEPDEPDGLSEDRRVLLFQSVRELLFNVVKHAGVDRAGLSMRALPGCVQVTVEDLGRGLPATPAPAQHEPRGSGLGLASVRERLEYVGGELAIDSRPGRYTRVTATVPVEPPAAEGAMPVAAPMFAAEPDAPPEPIAGRIGPANGKRRNGRRKIRVLLADDHKVLRDGLAGLLRAQPGIEVIGEAANGQEAVDLTARLHPDVIVMDISMPILTGIEATRRITQQHPGARVVGLSMHEESGMTAAMLEAGAEAYLTKGGPAEDLIAAIYGKPEPDAAPAPAPEPVHAPADHA
jgi:CheY-like chemotaxis protein